jgi:ketosteroid isomerase-like protein
MTNVERVREFWRLWSIEGFPELVARYDEFFTEDLVWHSPITHVTGTPRVGRQAFEEHIADLRDVWDEIQAEPEEIAEIAPGVVRSRVWIRGTGVRSGAVIDSPLIALSRDRGDRAAWVWASFDLDAAERVVRAVAAGEEVPN